MQIQIFLPFPMHGTGTDVIKEKSEGQNGHFQKRNCEKITRGVDWWGLHAVPGTWHNEPIRNCHVKYEENEYDDMDFLFCFF